MLFRSDQTGAGSNVPDEIIIPPEKNSTPEKKEESKDQPKTKPLSDLLEKKPKGSKNEDGEQQTSLF